MTAILSSDVLGNFIYSMITYLHIGFLSPVTCEGPLFIGHIFCSLCMSSDIIDQYIELVDALILDT